MLRQSRIALVHLSLVVFAVALVARAAQVQLVQTRQWTARAQRQHFASSDIPAPRGTIDDVRGVPLAVSREMVRLSVAPRELRDRRAAARALARLGVARDWAARATDPRRAWVDLPGSFLPGDAATLTAMRGVYTRPVVQRVYPTRDATRRIVGWVNDDGRAMGGLELALDSVLRGRDGRAVEARDSRGRRFASPADSDVEPVPGDAITLTINQELQEISQRALDAAITRTGADGGDIVILDPQDGEIRALASVRKGKRVFGSPALTEPFEPGSTLKPLFAARLLSLGLATPHDTVDTENGAYTLNGRTIHDLEPEPRLALPDVIRLSSNIGIVKFVSRLTPVQEFETLRDYGFGMPTGVPFPAEAAGVLRPPKDWSKQSPASLAMGYEIAVTPLQLAAAYGAIANGGALLEPAIVKQIRAPDGHVVYEHEPRVVRRVVSPAAAAEVRKMMVGVVQGGTGKEAALARFAMAGKSGTARAGRGGRYVGGDYTASFVALFPAGAPQYVVLVKLDDPRTTVFGGTAAAPVSKIVVEAAIAARDAALDRRALAASEVLSGTGRDSAGAANGEVADSVESVAPPAPPAVTVALPIQGRGAPPAATPRPVPDVRGLALRAAVLALHAAGFRVQLAGLGTAASTVPAAGALVRPGTLVRLVSAP